MMVAISSAARSYPFNSGPALDLDPAYAQLRADEPVSRVTLPYGGDAWLVTRYADVKAVLADPRFSRSAIVGRDVARVRPGVAKNAANLLNMDPPEHTRLRRLVVKALTASMVERLRSRTQEIMDDLLDMMAFQGPPTDLVEVVATPLAVTVICELLGVPASDHSTFRAWIDTIYSNSATQEDRAAAHENLNGYITEMVTQRRRKPTSDLIGALVMARDEGSRLSENELLTLSKGLLTAGQSSIPFQIGSFTYLLLTHPGQLASLRAEPELISRAIEEMLRFVPLVSAAEVCRIATQDVQLGNVTVSAGEMVLAALHAANRDPAVFTDPDCLALDRANSPHMGFGHGPHYCVGVHLVRMELEVAVNSLLRRFPDLRLAVPADAIEWP
jgi:nocardicin N-oxygenase